MKPLSLDLRKRIVSAYEQGEGSRSTLATRFGVGEATVQRLLQLKRTTGSLAPKPIGGSTPIVSDETLPRFEAWLEQDCDLTQDELAQRFEQETGQAISQPTVSRVLKRLENTAKSFYAVIEEGSAFVGTGLELALACDRTYLLDDPDVQVRLGVSGVHAGLYPMANGLSRLETRFLGTPDAVDQVLAAGASFDAATAAELGLASVAPDSIDWEDELRLAVEERVSFSPDAMTGMEQNLRFAGPETMETKIFGRLSAWQNWIFQRPNAVGEKGALRTYGTGTRPDYDNERV